MSTKLRIRKLTPKETIFYIMGLCGIIEEDKENNYAERIYPLLPVLWEEIGKKEIQREIRRFWSFQEKEILRCELYECSILESWKKHTNEKGSAYNITEDSQKNLELSKCVFSMWENWKSRYTPHRWGLSQQQFEQFNAFMSQLPHEYSQEKTNLQDLWETYKGFGLLQQTLFKIQEIWESSIPQEQSKGRLRIRKLVPLETMKLMGFTEEDYNAMKEIGMSDSAIYHCSGDSVVVSCWVSIMNPMVNEKNEHIEIVNRYVEKEIVNGN